MKIETKICDICNKELNKNNWEDNVGRLSLHFFKSCCNSVGDMPFSVNGNGQNAEIIYSDICYDCQQKVEKEVVVFLNKINTIAKKKV